LTLAAVREFAGDTLFLGEVDQLRNARMARVQDIVLVDHPADEKAPRLICVYQVDLLDAQPPLGEGKQFKFEPQCMLFAYQWLHKAEPADFRLVLMKDPTAWFGYVTALLLAALNLARPHLFEAIRHDPDAACRAPEARSPFAGRA
jgi:hypothetical protein